MKKPLFLFLFHHILLLATTLSALIPASEKGFHAAAALIYHARTQIDDIQGNHHPDSTAFTEEELTSLWQKVALELDHSFFQNAHENYYRARDCITANLNQHALDALNSSIAILNELSEEIAPNSAHTYLSKKISASDALKNHPYISNNTRKCLKPYLIPYNSPLKQILDGIFLSTRATTNDLTLINSGFNILSIQPRSFIRILRHPLLPEYLLKAYVDSVSLVKKNLQSWEWFVKRCQGADAVRTVIKMKKIKLFTVPQKWIYVFPPSPSPPADAFHTRHLAILIVDDMHLTSLENCVFAWYHQITTQHLDELYKIISFAKGSSYRPDNIALTNSGTFAFIDTEYPKSHPDFDSIKYFLSPPMLQYWNKLIKKGGP